MIQGLRRYLGIELLWVCAPLYALVVRVGLTAISPHDYWWPMVQGRAAAQLGAIPNTNLFLFTLPAEAPFFNQPWLAQRLMWWLSEWHGPTAGVYANAALLCASFLILMWAAHKLGASLRVNASAAMLAAIFASNGMSVRTQMFAVPCFAITLAVLMLAARRGFSFRRLWPLLVSVPLWANVHGSFVLAPVMVACLGAGAMIEASTWRQSRERLWHWTLLGVGVVGLASLTPSGPAVFWYAVTLTLKMGGGARVSEWAPMGFDVEGVVFYVAACASAVCVLIWRKQIGWGGMLWMAVVGWLALGGRRNLIWWAMSAQVVLAMGASAWWMTRQERAKELSQVASRKEVAFNVVLAAVLWSMALSCLPGGVAFFALTTPESLTELEPGAHLPYEGFEALNSEHPLRMLGRMRDEGYQGRLFHSQSFGGLVEYALARERPEAVAFVDQRFEMIPGDVWEDYFAVMQVQPGWEDVLERRGIGSVLLDTRGVGELVDALEASAEWCKRDAELDHVWYERCVR